MTSEEPGCATARPTTSNPRPRAHRRTTTTRTPARRWRTTSPRWTGRWAPTTTRRRRSRRAGDTIDERTRREQPQRERPATPALDLVDDADADGAGRRGLMVGERRGSRWPRSTRTGRHARRRRRTRRGRPPRRLRRRTDPPVRAAGRREPPLVGLAWHVARAAPSRSSAHRRASAAARSTQVFVGDGPGPGVHRCSRSRARTSRCRPARVRAGRCRAACCRPARRPRRRARPSRPMSGPRVRPGRRSPRRTAPGSRTGCRRRSRGPPGTRSRTRRRARSPRTARAPVGDQVQHPPQIGAAERIVGERQPRRVALDQREGSAPPAFASELRSIGRDRSMPMTRHARSCSGSATWPVPTPTSRIGARRRGTPRPGPPWCGGCPRRRAHGWRRSTPRRGRTRSTRSCAAQQLVPGRLRRASAARASRVTSPSW